MANSAIGIDVGATNIKAGLVSSEGQVLKELRRETRAGDGVEAVVSTICEVSNELSRAAQVSCIGVGAPGLVDPHTGTVRVPPNLPGWEEVPVKDLLQARVETPVIVANDVNMVTYGEWKFGAGRGLDNLLVITVGSGVGGGIVAGGSLHVGSHGLAGEIGHTTVDPDGPLCNCGNYGCLESFVGAEYLKLRAIRLINKGLRTSISGLIAGDLARITPEVISQAAAQGDSLAERLMRAVGEYLGIALANAISLLDPQRVVVGGGVSKAGDILFRAIRETVEDRLYSYPYTHIEVVPPALGDRGGIVGSATYAMTQLGGDLR